MRLIFTKEIAMSEREMDKMAGIDNLEIEPLSDEALESVAGGASDGSSGSCCSCCACSGSGEELAAESPACA
jgi:hypothetical protein